MDSPSVLRSGCERGWSEDWPGQACECDLTGHGSERGRAPGGPVRSRLEPGFGGRACIVVDECQWPSGPMAARSDSDNRPRVALYLPHRGRPSPGPFFQKECTLFLSPCSRLASRGFRRFRNSPAKAAKTAKTAKTEDPGGRRAISPPPKDDSAKQHAPSQSRVDQTPASRLTGTHWQSPRSAACPRERARASPPRR